jgi:serine-type D-Ala-D-Ala carboxypeptidase/endopeptidase (penicillin-binding protein 4)
MFNFQRLVCYSLLLLFFASCSIEKQISKSAKADVLDAKALQTAHIGISIFDPAENKYLYNYQGDKYFVPASNAKLPTCYAAMKYLGDSLVGLRYELIVKYGDTSMLIEPNGDPTFLHPDFKKQRVFDFLKDTTYKMGMSMPMMTNIAYGKGWSISDINESYMPPRSYFPVYGNVVRFEVSPEKLTVYPDYFDKKEFVVDAFGYRKEDEGIKKYSGINYFEVFRDSTAKAYSRSIPFTLDYEYPKKLIEDTLKRSIHYSYNRTSPVARAMTYEIVPERFTDEDYKECRLRNSIPVHSQPTDSLLKPMMHRSDNFFAEQSLLMVSNEMLGVMNDEKIIDTLLKTDFKDLPQKPRWADGSGLSRYNLFTPQDFVFILNKMKNEFGMERLKVILPTGGEGTISNYYKADSGYIYGKTGTLSGVVAFSGFLYTKKGKLLIFSTLVNNHHATATEVRRAVEKFLDDIRNKY